MPRGDKDRCVSPDGDVAYLPAFVPAPEANGILESLLGLPDWETLRLRMFGREVDAPRLTAWYGDPGCRYAYSGIVHEPLPWPAPIASLRDRLVGELGVRFNSVLANRYRAGSDSMGWHSDDEPELGPQPVIASLSFGAPRRFLLRHRTRKDAPTRELLLEHGSLLVMKGRSQQDWRHSVPKMRRCAAERVNLTFRRVRPR